MLTPGSTPPDASAMVPATVAAVCAATEPAPMPSAQNEKRRNGAMCAGPEDAMPDNYTYALQGLLSIDASHCRLLIVLHALRGLEEQREHCVLPRRLETGG